MIPRPEHEKEEEAAAAAADVEKSSLFKLKTGQVAAAAATTVE